MKSIFLLTLLFLSATSLFSQTDFATMIKDGDKLMNGGKYIEALKKYDAAEATAPRDKKNEAIKKREILFTKIESLRKEAVKAKDDTKKLLVEVQAQKDIADAALARAEKFINALDLEEGKLAMAYKNGKVGYINSMGDLSIPYRYETAGAFDNTGFAKVQTIEEFAIPNTLGVKTEYRPVDYLIDTDDKQYKVAYRLEDINTDEKITDTFKIMALDFRNIVLNSFPPLIIDQSQLEILILDPGLKKENNFKTIPKEIGNFQDLKYLSLRKCRIESLPAEIGQLKKLQTLDLRGNNLKILPDEIVQLGELKTLNLKENNLGSLPDGIGQLKKLQILLLTDNPIKSLPAGFNELTSLKVLDLSSTSLPAWPHGVERILSLQQLNFSRKSLNIFPPEILQLINLEILDISFNQIKNLPTNIKKLAKLKSLSLRTNELTDLVQGFEELKNLQELDLAGNNLVNFPTHILKLKNLESLDLSFNRSLKVIPPQISDLKNLKTLKLIKTAIPESDQKKIREFLPWCNVVFIQVSS